MRTRRRTRETESLQSGLAVKSRLAEKLGRDVFESWFSKLTLVQLSEGLVLRRPPSKFVARWLTEKYHDQVLAAWRELEPSVVTVRFDHTAIAAPEIISCMRRQRGGIAMTAPRLGEGLAPAMWLRTPEQRAFRAVLVEGFDFQGASPATRLPQIGPFFFWIRLFGLVAPCFLRIIGTSARACTSREAVLFRGWR